MSLTTYANQKILTAYGQNASVGSPATFYVGLLTATIWQATHAYTLNQYVIPTTFASKVTAQGQQGVIFVCTTAGTSGASEPTWPSTEGGTVTDGGVTWTEVSLRFQAGTFTGAEVAGNAYGRIAVTANSTNFPAASSAEPSVLSNGTAINFASPTADWGLVPGWIKADALTVGNIWEWGVMTTALDAASGSNPSIAVGALQTQLSALLTA